MQIKPLKLNGTYGITLKRHTDPRGYFMETYVTSFFEEHGLVTAWAQENQSFSKDRCILRGLHFQLPPHAETKLVRVLTGAVLDVFVDLRRDSPTFGQWDSVTLTAEQANLVYIPKGFAHAFCTLTDNVLVSYKVDARYNVQAQGGLRWNDPAFNIDWPCDAPLLSEKDSQLPFFAEFESPF